MWPTRGGATLAPEAAWRRCFPRAARSTADGSPALRSRSLRGREPPAGRATGAPRACALPRRSCSPRLWCSNLRWLSEPRARRLSAARGLRGWHSSLCKAPRRYSAPRSEVTATRQTSPSGAQLRVWSPPHVCAARLRVRVAWWGRVDSRPGASSCPCAKKNHCAKKKASIARRPSQFAFPAGDTWVLERLWVPGRLFHQFLFTAPLLIKAQDPKASRHRTGAPRH